MPREPLRTIATSSPARRAAPRDRRGHRVGAAGDRGGVARDEDAPDHADEPRRSARRAAPGRAGRRPAVDHRRRAGGAEAEAVDRLERDARRRWSLPQAVPSRASARATSASQPIDWQASARQSFSTCRPAGACAEVVVEGDDPVHLGARQVERLGDHRDRVARHVTEGRLHVVQDRQQRPLAAGMPRRRWPGSRPRSSRRCEPIPSSRSSPDHRRAGDRDQVSLSVDPRPARRHRRRPPSGTGQPAPLRLLPCLPPTSLVSSGLRQADRGMDMRAIARHRRD